MRKIAFFTRDLKVGGIQRSIVNILNNIDLEEYYIDLYLFDEDIFYELPKNVNIIFLKKPCKIFQFLPFEVVNKILRLDIKKTQYDVSIDFDSYQVYTALGALKCNSFKKVIWIHNDISIKIKEEFKYKILHYFFKNKYKYFDVMCAVSQGALDGFKKLYPELKKDYYIIPNYIDTGNIKKQLEEKCPINVDDKKINIVSVGRMCHQKGFDLLLEDIAELKNFRKDFHLFLIGDGPDKQKLINIIKKKELENFVTILGNQKNPFKFLKKMDIFILESRYEGQGMVILEALSVGLKIIIPKRLEKYCDPIKGVNNIVDELIKYKVKRKKKFDSLYNYNNKITNSLNDIFK